MHGMWCLQVLLVAGGKNGGFINDHESSTEVLTTDSPVWTLATPLPRALLVVKGVTVAGTFYMTGKLYWVLTFLSTVLQVAMMLMMMSEMKFLPGWTRSRCGRRQAR